MINNKNNSWRNVAIPNVLLGMGWGSEFGYRGMGYSRVHIDPISKAKKRARKAQRLARKITRRNRK